MAKDALILGCQAGDKNSQKEFLEKYSGFVFAICVRYCGDMNYAWDLLQEIFVKIFVSIPGLNPKLGNIEPWIGTIARNHCLNYMKSKRITFKELNIQEIPLSIRNGAIEEMTSQELINLIGMLPDGYREIFNMIETDGMSTQEVAKFLGMAESSVRSKLSRSKSYLKKILLKIKSKEAWMNSI